MTTCFDSNITKFNKWMETNLHRFNADRSITIEWRDACNEKQSNNKYFTNNEIRKWNTNHTTQGPLINPQRQFCVNINIHTHTHMILIDVLHVNYYIGFEKKICKNSFCLSFDSGKDKQKIAYKINNIG